MALDFTELDAIVADSPGAAIGEDFFTELKSNLQFIDGKGLGGDSAFAGLTGVAIAIAEQADTDYMPVITLTENPGGNLGEVWVVVDSTTQFTVYNSGSATTAFRWRIIP